MGECTVGQEKWKKFHSLNDLKMDWREQRELSITYCEEQVQSNVYVL